MTSAINHIFRAALIALAISFVLLATSDMNCSAANAENTKKAVPSDKTRTADHLRENEELIFGFSTKKGKVLTIAKDKAGKYIIYRFGPPGKVEFEFPPDGKDSYELMTYSSYMSPGNADLNYLRFKNDDFMYVVYDEYGVDPDSGKGMKFVGIKLINQKQNKTYDIKGDTSTRRGSLMDLRFMDKVNSDGFSL